MLMSCCCITRFQLHMPTVMAILLLIPPPPSNATLAGVASIVVIADKASVHECLWSHLDDAW